MTKRNENERLEICFSGLFLFWSLGRTRRVEEEFGNPKKVLTIVSFAQKKGRTESKERNKMKVVLSREYQNPTTTMSTNNNVNI